MVDISSKADVYRYSEARAEADVKFDNCAAGALAAKLAYRFIPLLHPIPISASARCFDGGVVVEAESTWKTGVEMDALFGALVGAIASGASKIYKLSVVQKVKGLGAPSLSEPAAAPKPIPRPDVGLVATAEGRIRLRSIDVVKAGAVEKGDPLCAAKIAAALSSKRLCELLPVECVYLEYANTEVKVEDEGVAVSVVLRARGSSPSLEALFAAGAALLTIWDMTKKYEKDERGQYPSTFIELGLS
ncbi:MAG: cyclic pyranopterin monophosphate synthase MoaC [Thermoproteus sp. AZ2]|jgi:cyclic pyranopterin phosphate synthase|uniref:Cyclic pyranopterin monophosphate synthase MoaC n=1 Tax=Thermoproteus sp. AZ2 TaxID=1609232 RepID=A0ACC6V418_9CREN